MPLREFRCLDCNAEFEILLGPQAEREGVKCLKCGGNRLQKQISRFSVAGRGDLRESTWHGCHGPHAPDDEKGHDHSSESHDHSHDHHDHHDHSDAGIAAENHKKTGTDD